MSFKRVALSGLVLAVSGSLLASVPLAAPASADVTSPQATTALDLPAGVTVAGFTGSPLSRAVADTALDPAVAFNDFPSRGSSYVMLSSGDATKVFEGVPTSQLSTDVGNDGAPDASSLTLTVAAGTANTGCLLVDFALGTEEALGYSEGTAGDRLSIVNDGRDYAVNAGRGYFSQSTWQAEPKLYQVYALGYWHKPGDPLDPEPGTAEEPRLAPVTGLNNVTSRDTARIPLDLAGGDEVVTIKVEDATNGDLDSVAFVDDVRLAPSCDNGTGVEPEPENRDIPNSCCGIIRGIRGVGNALVYDPVPTTETIERYDAPANGWRSPSGVPVELRFRWYRTTTPNKNSGNMAAWTAIPNADRQTYVPTSVDRGKVLIVLVTGVVDGRRVETFPATSTADAWYVTLPIDNGTFVEGGGPVISGPADGSAAVGDTLTAQIGSTVPRQDTYEWQWYAKNPGGTGVGSPVSGANAQTLVIPESLAGKVLTVRATAQRASFQDRSWDSPAYGPIELQSWTSTPSPQIVDDGTPRNGETLTVVTGAWAPEPGSYSYQWKRDGAVIPGATSASYTLKDADVGVPVTVDVSGVKTGYPLVPRASQPVTPAGQTMTGAPVTITGTAAMGELLTGGPGAADWVPSYARLTYAWYAGQTLVQSGASRNYRVTPAVVGQRITLAVTATKSGFDPKTTLSEPTAVVARGRLTAGTVQISGTPKVGSTVRASTGYWKPTPVTFTYRWKIGSRLVAGAAGRRSTLTLPRSAKGKRVTLVVTGTKAGYTTLARSVVSAKVKA
ncbi:hypothetical protein [Nocardioides sp.]|uniref:hypothetical protein n=1 Tax=Nocardioides sp. TaxID=35761 RepID=UPI0027226058|nr:hypothetical protein [Nocardioides sp.]MDO9458455.1 hypothetical protein [Nocardioides sp.]